jgi:hypothetical protein
MLPVIPLALSSSGYGRLRDKAEPFDADQNLIVWQVVAYNERFSAAHTW